MNNQHNDILYLIFINLDFLSKIRLKRVSKNLNSLEIYDFYNIEKKYLRLLNDQILSKYYFIKYLDASYNNNITNVNHMYNLQKLKTNNSGITNDGIKNVNLVELNASSNEKIIDVNHMTNLKILNAFGKSGITNNGIKNLNLVKLIASLNEKIIDVNHMTNLKELSARRKSGITNEGLKNINLNKLDAYQNFKITNVSHMTNLTKLFSLHEIKR
jgi:hypothetical protein